MDGSKIRLLSHSKENFRFLTAVSLVKFIYKEDGRMILKNTRYDEEDIHRIHVKKKIQQKYLLLSFDIQKYIVEMTHTI